MSAEHSHRWQHRTHAATTRHWHGDVTVPGTVADCDECSRDLRKPGEAFCSDCPDHEGCLMGYPCGLVKRVHKETTDEA